MSNVKFCALGGLGENGKNMYLVEADEKIFILDAGLKHPSIDLFGVDAVLPDIRYLKENEKKIVGVFLSHGHDDHIGAVTELLKQIPVPIYGSKFTIALVEAEMQEAGLKIEDYRLFRAEDEKKFSFGNTSVTFFSLNHSIPGSMGISVHTNDGAIVYTPDFSLASSTDKNYRTNFGKISEIGKNGVLALLTESLGTSNINRVSNDYALIHALTDILQNSKRVIFSMFSNELQRIQKVINVCVSQNRRIAIIGKKAQKTINVAINNNYLKIPAQNSVNLKYITDENQNNEDDLVIIITGVRHEPYYTLQRMAFGNDRLVHLNDQDHIVIVSQPTTGTEILAQKALSVLHRLNSKITVISKDQLQSSHADNEDLKMMYEILQPKYIIPVCGEYRHQFMQKNVALEAGYTEDKILMLDNGEMISFKDGIFGNKKTQISVGDVLIDGSIVGDINEIVLKDRELLGNEGIILVVTTIDSRSKQIIAGPKVVLKGFFVGETANDVTNSLSELSENIINKYLNRRQVDWTELKSLLRDAINKQIYSLTKKNPIIMPVLIDVEKKD
ncbi:MAG: ribonuclease J [Bacilli bacterium]